MIIYRNKHGSFKGGLFKTKISPAITTASFEHNTFILKNKRMCDKIIKLANLQIKGRIEQQTRVYSTKGISPTLTSAMGHGCIPLFLIVKEI